MTAANSEFVTLHYPFLGNVMYSLKDSMLVCCKLTCHIPPLYSCLYGLLWSARPVEISSLFCVRPFLCLDYFQLA